MSANMQTMPPFSLESVKRLTPEKKAELIRLLELRETNRARAGLIDFACYIDKQAQQWYRAAHLRTIASVLERVERGELKRVIISVPPRHWKSSLASVKFPAWYLGKHNDHSIIIASYALSLAEKYSVSVRDTIQSNSRYKQLFDIRVKRDSNRANDWLLETGYQTTLRAVGTGGGIAGYGFKLAVLDDVSDPNTQSSPTETAKDWEWYKNVIRTRAEPDAAIVVVNNRVGVNDLVGYLLDPERNDSADPPEDWEYVKIPAMDVVTGRYVWDARFGNEFYEKLRRDPYLWSIQYQQETEQAAGKEIRREWFEFVEQLPEGVREQCRVVDTAWTLKKTEKQDPDYTASIGSAAHEGWLYLVEPHEVRQELPETVEWIREQKRARGWVRFGMARAAGEAIGRQFLTRLGIPIEELTGERADLRVRLATFIYWARNGKVKLVGEPKRWERFLQQATAFPMAKHDDLLAVCAGLTEMHGLKIDGVSGGKRQERRNDWAFAEE